jgi:ADP-ribosylglycohydrolase
MPQQFSIALPILGAITGDIVGSVYERNPIKTKEFPLINDEMRWTDDTVLTIAIAEALMEKRDIQTSFLKWGRLFPYCGYGGQFGLWLKQDNPKPYGSFGNGSAMRVSAIGSAFDTLEQTIEEATRSALPTHDHPEGVKGAQAAAVAIFLARTLHTKREIRYKIESMFGYDLNRTIDDVRNSYQYDLSCQKTVPEAIICFLESKNYEDAIRNAISLGGDSDTLACITGGIAAAYYRFIPGKLVKQTLKRLHPDMLKVMENFECLFHISTKLGKSRMLDALVEIRNLEYFDQNKDYIYSALKELPSNLPMEDLLQQLEVIVGTMDEKKQAEVIAQAFTRRIK